MFSLSCSWLAFYDIYQRNAWLGLEKSASHSLVQRNPLFYYCYRKQTLSFFTDKSVISKQQKVISYENVVINYTNLV